MNDFWLNFLPNFFANLCSDILIGLFAYNLISAKLADKEKERFEKEKLIKKQNYLKGISTEVLQLKEKLSSFKRENGIRIEDNIQFDYWNTLTKSGEIVSELANLFGQDLLEEINAFYSRIGELRELFYRYQNNQNSSFPLSISNQIFNFIREISEKYFINGDLLNKIKNEIKSNSEKLEKLENQSLSILEKLRKWFSKEGDKRGL